MSTTTPTRAPTVRPGTLLDRFDPRHNNLDLLRLAFAALVVVDHGVIMATGTQHHWGRSTLGDFAVDGFFILSGFLITRSYLSVGSLVRFTWHRMLRILPGFWVCLLLTAVVVAPLGAVLGGLPVTAAFTGSPSAQQYVLVNAGLLINDYVVGDVFAANPNPSIINGSLWTLALEALCYALVGLLGVLAVLRRAPWVVPALAALVWVLTLLQMSGRDVLLGDGTLRMLLLFLVGATAFLFADRIPLRGWLAALAAVVVLVSILTLDDYRILGVVPATYVVLWLGTSLPWSRSLRTDLSYGIYIFHWPILQLLATTPLVRAPLWLFLTVGILTVLPVALASWHLVEHPALRQKHRTLPRRRR